MAEEKKPETAAEILKAAKEGGVRKEGIRALELLVEVENARALAQKAAEGPEEKAIQQGLEYLRKKDYGYIQSRAVRIRFI